MSIFKKLRELYNFFFNKLFLNRTLFINNSCLIGREVYINENSVLKAKKVIIGDYTRINGPIVIRGDQLVKIGKYCAFGFNINIISTNHKTNYANLQRALQYYCGFQSIVQDLGPVLIGNNVWSGDNVTILAGVEIGDGAVLGAGCVVNKNVAPFSIVVGIPAKIIKMRFSNEMINELLRIKWWNWDKKKIKNNKEFFETELNKVSVETLRSLIK